MKEDCILQDFSSTATFHIWENLISELQDNLTYKFYKLVALTITGTDQNRAEPSRNRPELSRNRPGTDQEPARTEQEPTRTNQSRADTM